jgi:hypothetical protein
MAVGTSDGTNKTSRLSTILHERFNTPRARGVLAH